MAAEATLNTAFKIIRQQAYESANHHVDLGRTAARLLAEHCGPFIIPSGSDTLYLLDKCCGTLFEFASSDKDFKRLLVRLDLPFEKKTINAMIECARGLALEADVHRISWYDQNLDTAYVYSQGKDIYAISANGIQTIANGTDNIYFLREPAAKPFELVDGSATDQHFKNLLKSVVKPAPGLVSPDFAIYMLIIWFCCMFLTPLITTMPVLMLVGPAGSNKSFLLQLFSLLLTGRRTEAIPREAIDSSLSSRGFVAIDNLSDVPRRLMERLEATVYRQSIILPPRSSAKAYQTLTIDCRLAATARDVPKSAMERLGKFLVIELERIVSLRESSLIHNTATNRNVIMTSVMLMVQKIIRSFDAANGTDYSGPFPCSDLANIAVRLARLNHPQGEQFVRDGLQRMASVTARAVKSPDQTVIELMKLWIPENAGKEFKPKELHIELKRLADQHGMTLVVTEKRFGNTINRLRNKLESLFHMTSEKRGGNFQHYSFHLKEKASDNE